MRHALLLLAGLALTTPAAAAPVPRDRVPENRPPGYLGIYLQDDPGGARVTGVLEGSPAAGAGIQADDVVTSIDGMGVPNAATLMASVMAKKAGDEVTVAVARPAGVVVLRARLMARPADPGPISPPPQQP